VVFIHVRKGFPKVLIDIVLHEDTVSSTRLCELSDTLLNLLLVNETVHMLMNISHNVMDFLFIKRFKHILLFRIYDVLVDFILA